MTNRHFLFIFAVITSLASCTTSGPAQDVETTKKASTQLAFPPLPDEPHYYYERTIRGNLDILPDEDSGGLRRALTGEKRKAIGLVKPYAIAARHGVIYVGDAPRHSVMVFDIPGQKFFQIGLEDDDEGHGKLARPMGLDIDKAGNLYVLDANLHQIMVYGNDGKFIREFGNSTQLYKPAGIAVTPDGSRVYAVDIGGTSSEEHKVVVYDGITGKFLRNIGHRGTESGEFNLPRDVTIAPDGSIYVVDGGNFRVQKFDKDEKYLSFFGGIGRQTGQFSRPKEAAVDPSGNVYVVDTAFGNFQIFNPDGKLLMAIGQRGNSNGPAIYSLPAGIAVDDDGRIYVVDQYFTKVDVFRPIELPEDGGWIGKFNKKTATDVAQDSIKKPSADLNSKTSENSPSAVSNETIPASGK
jgi:DNA-binding beta-propeller fold protein YncE